MCWPFLAPASGQGLAWTAHPPDSSRLPVEPRLCLQGPGPASRLRIPSHTWPFLCASAVDLCGCMTQLFISCCNHPSISSVGGRGRGQGFSSPETIRQYRETISAVVPRGPAVELRGAAKHLATQGSPAASSPRPAGLRLRSLVHTLASPAGLSSSSTGLMPRRPELGSRRYQQALATP